MNTIAAIIFMLGCWFYILVAAFTWGLWKAFFSLLKLLTYIVIYNVDIELFRIGLYFLDIADSFIEPFKKFFSSTWNWAKHEHPWIAFFIGIFCIADLDDTFHLKKMNLRK